MPKDKRSKEKKLACPSHTVLTLPLVCEPWQADRLEQTFYTGWVLYNCLTAEKKGHLVQLQNNKRWRENQASISEVYEKYKPLLKGLKEDSPEAKKLKTARSKELEPFFSVKQELLRSYGFTKCGFEASVKKYRRRYKHLINAQVAQKVAYSVWDKFESLFFRDGEEIHFKRYTDFTHLEGKGNDTGFRYRDGFLYTRGMAIPVKLSKPDTYNYEKELLSHPICYCGITRRPSKTGRSYFLQLVVKGPPPIKKKVDGTPLHKLGSGTVGHDIGPQTIASVGEDTLFTELAEDIQPIWDKLRRINRALDRSRRATNPQFFNEDGSVITRDKLDKKLLTPSGKRRWVKSNHYKRLETQHRYWYSKYTTRIQQSHNILANRLLGLGNTHLIEDMDWKALAKREKETKKTRKGKFKSKKRYGKSIAKKSPATFVNILEGKVLRNGGRFIRVPCADPKASQYDHITRGYKKVPLSQRVKEIDGHLIQRDLYSAYLLKHWDTETHSYNQQGLENNFPDFIEKHDNTMQSMKCKTCPSSMGVKSF